MIPLLRRVALLGAVLATSSLLSVPPAQAHEGEGVLTVESQQADGPDATTYVVRLVWADDGHAALDATLTATPVAPGGEARTPVPLTAVDEDGRYQATVPFDLPGRWTVRFTSVTPVGTLEVARQVAQPEPTTSTTEAAAPTTTPPATATTTAAPTEPADADDDSSSTPVIVAVLVVIAAFAGTVAFVLTRSRRGPPASSPGTGE